MVAAKHFIKSKGAKITNVLLATLPQFPLWFIKGLVYIRAKRLYVVRMVIEDYLWKIRIRLLEILRKR